VALSEENEDSLSLLLTRAREMALDPIAFFEPDLGDALTAIAFNPHPNNKKYLSNLPLAGRKGK
jgi:hypothetical protein